jgi:hypothetical protein
LSDYGSVSIINIILAGQVGILQRPANAGDGDAGARAVQGKQR